MLYLGEAELCESSVHQVAKGGGRGKPPDSNLPP